jgi:uncharacterized protein
MATSPHAPSNTGGLLYRAAVLQHSEGRMLHGRILPYNEPTEVTDGWRPYREMFAFGSLQRSLAERGHKIHLLAAHDQRKFPIGRAVELNEQPDGVHGVFAVSDTSDGNDLLTLVRDGIVTGFSVGFTPIRDRQDGDVIVRLEASLREVSAVTRPAYAGAEIVGVRAAERFVTHSIAAARLRLTLLGGSHV